MKNATKCAMLARTLAILTFTMSFFSPSRFRMGQYLEISHDQFLSSPQFAPLIYQ